MSEESLCLLLREVRTFLGLNACLLVGFQKDGPNTYTPVCGNETAFDALQLVRSLLGVRAHQSLIQTSKVIINNRHQRPRHIGDAAEAIVRDPTQNGLFIALRCLERG